MDAAHGAVLLDPEIREELLASRPDFFPGERGPSAAGDERARSERRHLEWFLAERSIREPLRERVEALIESAALEVGVDPEEWRLALERSHAGLFEVIGSEAGPERALRDLAGRFEGPLVDDEETGDLRVGEIVAGRLFPTAAGGFHVSPAASRFRSARLLGAIRSDIERALAGRPPAARGSPRLRAIEIEAILQGRSREAVPAQSTRRPQAVLRARALLREGGLAPEETEELLQWLASEAPDPTRILPGGGDVLGDVLDTLAFETDVDLEAARSVLIEAWDELHEPAPAAVRAGPAAEPRDVAAAIAEFDRKRREGAPLERALSDLERDLDLGDEPDEEDEGATELHGVVAGVVEEFLWDEARLHGEASADRFLALRDLGRAADAVSVFENLGRRELTDFASRWVIEEGGLRDPGEARILLEGLDRFCLWVEENHDVPLHAEFAPVLTGLRGSLPRVALANSAARGPGERPSGEEWLELVERSGPDAGRFTERSGRTVEIRVDPSILEHLQAGDWIRGRRRSADGIDVEACYPPEVREVLAP